MFLGVDGLEYRGGEFSDGSTTLASALLSILVSWRSFGSFFAGFVKVESFFSGFLGFVEFAVFMVFSIWRAM